MFKKIIEKYESALEKKKQTLKELRSFNKPLDHDEILSFRDRMDNEVYEKVEKLR